MRILENLLEDGAKARISAIRRALTEVRRRSEQRHKPFADEFQSKYMPLMVVSAYAASRRLSD